METKRTPYEKQIFVCTNNANKEKPSCGDHQGEDIFKALRQLAKDKGIHPRIRVAQAKCLGQCAMGTNIMIYPDNIWLSHVHVNDVETIAKEYLTQG